VAVHYHPTAADKWALAHYGVQETETLCTSHFTTVVDSACLLYHVNAKDAAHTTVYAGAFASASVMERHLDFEHVHSLAHSIWRASPHYRSTARGAESRGLTSNMRSVGYSFNRGEAKPLFHLGKDDLECKVWTDTIHLAGMVERASTAVFGDTVTNALRVEIDQYYSRPIQQALHTMESPGAQLLGSLRHPPVLDGLGCHGAHFTLNGRLTPHVDKTDLHMSLITWFQQGNFCDSPFVLHSLGFTFPLVNGATFLWLDCKNITHGTPTLRTPDKVVTSNDVRLGVAWLNKQSLATNAVNQVLSKHKAPWLDAVQVQHTLNMG
jgi:hypothetical protein